MRFLVALFSLGLVCHERQVEEKVCDCHRRCKIVCYLFNSSELLAATLWIERVRENQPRIITFLNRIVPPAD
jgi:hypothetical protein